MDLTEKYQGSIPSVGLEYTEENWIQHTSVTGAHLHTYRMPVSDPLALVFIFHGMHSHSNMYSHIAHYLADKGMMVCAFDQEHHGKSGGQFGSIRSLMNYVEDSVNFVLMVKNIYQKIPVFILGESMGGAISVYLSLELPRTVNGMILLAPALGIAPDFEPFLRRLVKFIACCCPRLQLKEPEFETYSRNPAYPDYYKDDTYIYSGKMEAGTGADLLRGLERLETRLREVSVPFIVFQGGEDHVTSEEAVNLLMQEAPVIDKERVYYEKMYHSISSEPEIEEIINQISKWIIQRLEE